MVVDDDPAMADVTQKRVELLGYSATSFTNSHKAWEHFKENPPITRGTPKEVKSLFDETADKIIKAEIEKLIAK